MLCRFVQFARPVHSRLRRTCRAERQVMCRHDRGLIDRYFEGFCSPLDSRGSELTDEDAIRRTNLKVGDRAYERGVEVQFGTTLWDVGVVDTRTGMRNR